MSDRAEHPARAGAARAALTVGTVETEYLRCGSGRPVLVLDPRLTAAIAASEVPLELRDRRLIAPLRTTIEALATPVSAVGAASAAASAAAFDSWLRGMIDGLGLSDLTVLVVPSLEADVRRFVAANPGEIAQVIATGG